MFEAGDVVVTDFPGATGVKRRPAVILSSTAYHRFRPDAILGIITSQTGSVLNSTDAFLQDWASAGLRLPSVFRSFLATIPQSAVLARIGRLSPRDWDAVLGCLRIALTDLRAGTPG